MNVTHADHAIQGKRIDDGIGIENEQVLVKTFSVSTRAGCFGRIEINLDDHQNSVARSRGWDPHQGCQENDTKSRLIVSGTDNLTVADDEKQIVLELRE